MKFEYSFAGDEFLFIKINNEMSLEACFSTMFIVNQLQNNQINGIIEICAANASFQIYYNPDIINPNKLLKIVQNITQKYTKKYNQYSKLNTRLIEIPVFYQDPWTTDTAIRFKDRHQNPKLKSNLDYAREINGFSSNESFIKAHSGSPWLVSMVGFVAGLPFLYQMVERKHQIQVPKYLSPRTYTPKQTIGHGGCFSCIYSVEGAGGYQMFGITPAPIFDPEQKKVPYLKNNIILFNPTDIVKFKPINKEEYDFKIQEVEKGIFNLNIHNIVFDFKEFIKNPSKYNDKILKILQ